MLRNRQLPGLRHPGRRRGLSTSSPSSANGGYMPSSPDAWLQLNGVAQLPVAGYTNAALAGAHTLLPFLGDIFVLPRPLPFATVFSIGDVLIGVGAAVFLVRSMRLPPGARRRRASCPPSARRLRHRVERRHVRHRDLGAAGAPARGAVRGRRCRRRRRPVPRRRRRSAGAGGAVERAAVDGCSACPASCCGPALTGARQRGVHLDTGCAGWLHRPRARPVRSPSAATTAPWPACTRGSWPTRWWSAACGCARASGRVSWKPSRASQRSSPG